MLQNCLKPCPILMKCLWVDHNLPNVFRISNASSDQSTYILPYGFMETNIFQTIIETFVCNLKLTEKILITSSTTINTEKRLSLLFAYFYFTFFFRLEAYVSNLGNCGSFFFTQCSDENSCILMRLYKTSFHKFLSKSDTSFTALPTKF